MTTVLEQIFEFPPLFIMLSTFTALCAGYVFVLCAVTMAFLTYGGRALTRVGTIQRAWFWAAIIAISVHAALIAGLVTPSWSLFMLAFAASDMGCLALLMTAAMVFHIGLLWGRFGKEP